MNSPAKMTDATTRLAEARLRYFLGALSLSSPYLPSPTRGSVLILSSPCVFRVLVAETEAEWILAQPIKASTWSFDGFVSELW